MLPRRFDLIIVVDTIGYFKIGMLLKPKGLKGELHAYLDFDHLEKIRFNTFFLEIAGRLVPYFIISIKYLQKNAAYVTLEDVNTIEKAAPLAKKDIFLPDKLRPKKKKEEFTLMDLVGFTVIDEDEGELGVLNAIQEYPQQLVAAVNYKNCEVLFPLNKEIIKGIDVVKEIVRVDLPEGLLDIYLD